MNAAREELRLLVDEKCLTVGRSYTLTTGRQVRILFRLQESHAGREVPQPNCRRIPRGNRASCRAARTPSGGSPWAPTSSSPPSSSVPSRPGKPLVSGSIVRKEQKQARSRQQDRKRACRKARRSWWSTTSSPPEHRPRRPATRSSRPDTTSSGSWPSWTGSQAAARRWRENTIARWGRSSGSATSLASSTGRATILKSRSRSSPTVEGRFLRKRSGTSCPRIHRSTASAWTPRAPSFKRCPSIPRGTPGNAGVPPAYKILGLRPTAGDRWCRCLPNVDNDDPIFFRRT